MKCKCGNEFDTPFCPKCGRAGGDGRVKLLWHLRRYRDQQQKYLDRYRSVQDTKRAEQQERIVAKWDCWIRFVRNAIEAGISAEQPTD